MLGALFLSLAATGWEMFQVYRVWDTCDAGGPGAGIFLFSFPPVLAIGQFAVVALIALAILSPAWSRSSAAVLAVVAAVVSVVVLALCAWMFFVYAGFPVETEYCPTPQPSWWRD